MVVVENLRREEVTIDRRGLTPYLEDRTWDRGARHRERVYVEFIMKLSMEEIDAQNRGILAVAMG